MHHVRVGVLRFYGQTGDTASVKRNHVITLQTEHKCVLDPCRALEGEGYQVPTAEEKGKGGEEE